MGSGEGPLRIVEDGDEGGVAHGGKCCVLSASLCLSVCPSLSVSVCKSWGKVWVDGYKDGCF